MTGFLRYYFLSHFIFSTHSSSLIKDLRPEGIPVIMNTHLMQRAFIIVTDELKKCPKLTKSPDIIS